MGKGGGGGGPTQTTSTSYQTNLPEYARPYVETMLGATQKQLFQTQQTPGSYNPETGETTGGTTEVTGFQPYRAYGGTYDASGNMTSYDPSKAIAGFQPMQEAAQRGIAGLQVPGQFDAATQAAMMGTQGALNAGNYQAGYFGNQFRAPGQYTPGQFSMAQAQAPELQQYQMSPAERVGAPGMDASLMQAAQTGYNPNLQAFQMGPAQQVGTQDYTGANVSQYMSPYMQDVVSRQQQAAQREADIAAQTQKAQFAQAGAFGGGRQGVAQARAAEALARQKGDIQAQGLQSAYQQAQQQFNQEQQARLAAQQANLQAGLTTGQQNLAAQLGVQQLGTQTGLQTALANLQAQQQANLANQGLLGQYGLQQGQFGQQAAMQNAQLAQQAALANQQMGYNTGLQNLQARLATQQLGAGQNLQAQLANQQALMQAQQAAEQSRQFGAGYGMQGTQQQLAAAGQLGNLGQGQFGTQLAGIRSLADLGATQQQLAQQPLDFGYQQWQQSLQYPYQQATFMQSLLGGLPLQATPYNAGQSGISSAMQGGLAGLGLYNLFNKP